MIEARERIGRYVEVRGTPAYYESCGEGVPLLCVHSAGTSGMLYRHTLPSLARHGFQVIAVDLPGHGKSLPIDWEPINDLHEYAEWLLEFCANVGIDSPIVVGTSIGGNIAIDLAVTRSADIRAAIAFEGAAFTPTFPGAGILQEPHTISWESNADAVAPAVVRPDATPEQLKEITWLHTSGSQRYYANDLIGWDKQDLRDRLGEVSVPVMLAVGTGDWFVPEGLVADTAEGIPDARFVRLEELGHWPLWEDPERANAAVLDFLREHGIAPDASAGAS